MMVLNDVSTVAIQREYGIIITLGLANTDKLKSQVMDTAWGSGVSIRPIMNSISSASSNINLAYFS